MAHIVTLGSLGELRTGFQVRSAITDVPEAPHRLITLGDVTDEGIAYDKLARMDLGDRLWRYVLNPGDILLRPRGANYKAAVIQGLDGPIVATAPLYVFRLQADDALPDYLAWWINRDEVQEKLANEARGSYIPTVSKETLARLELPLATMETQKRVADVQSLRRQERNLVGHLESLRDQQIEAALEAAALRQITKQ
ncbi:hypothetical protein [Fimbriimonas ginsengisoli]|nr:hypothetical protein [Fimbriimonas ginsengisoli]